MAIAALISLEHTMRRVLYYGGEPFDDVDILKDAIFDRLDDSRGSSKRLEALDAQIRDEVYKFEDALESHLLDMLLSQSEDLGSTPDDRILAEDVREQFKSLKEATKKIVKSVDESDNTTVVQEEEEEDLGSPPGDRILFEDVREQFESFKEATEKIMKSVDDEEEEEGEEEDLDSTTFGFEENKPQRVRFYNDKLTIVGYPLEEWRARVRPRARARARLWRHPNVFTLIGMAGTGRTILARSVFNDPDISNYFQRRAWVTVGPNCEYEEIIESILTEIGPQGIHDSLLGKEDNKIHDYLDEIMKQRMRCLIVMDDVQDPLDLMGFLEKYTPWPYDECRVLMTVHEWIYPNDDFCIFNIYAMRVLRKEESWDLLRKLVFAPQLCPPELVKAGTKIAANCKGLAVEIAKTALFLSSTEKTPEHWDNVSAEMENCESKDEYDEMYEISKAVTCSDSTDSARMITELLGLSYAIDYIKMNLISTSSKPETDITSFLGMAGIGKTFYAKRIFEDRSSNFDCRVWVAVGQNYREDMILGDIIAQIDDNENKRSREMSKYLLRDALLSWMICGAQLPCFT